MSKWQQEPLRSDAVDDPGAPLSILLGLSVGSLVSLGFGRLAYSLMVPTIRVELGWSYEEIAWIATVFTVGYLLGAAAVPPIVRRIGSRRSFILGSLATSALLAATGGFTGLASVGATRLAAGFMAAISFVVGSTLVAASSGSVGRARLAIGIYLGAGGLGMVVSAGLVPLISAAGGWGLGWYAVGVVAGMSALLGSLAARRGREPSGRTTGAAQAARSAREPPLWPLLVSYTLFGAGYLSFATLVVAFVRFRLGFSPAEIAGFWGVCGASGLVGAVCWPPVLGRLSGRAGIALLNACCMAGALVACTVESRPAVYLGMILFGVSFLTVAAAVLTFVRRTAHPSRWTPLMSRMTVGFSVGQCLGPVFAGRLSDGRHGIEAGLYCAVALLGGAAIFALFQREPEPSPSDDTGEPGGAAGSSQRMSPESASAGARANRMPGT